MLKIYVLKHVAIAMVVVFSFLVQGCDKATIASIDLPDANDRDQPAPGSYYVFVEANIDSNGVSTVTSQDTTRILENNETLNGMNNVTKYIQRMQFLRDTCLISYMPDGNIAIGVPGDSRSWTYFPFESQRTIIQNMLDSTTENGDHIKQSDTSMYEGRESIGIDGKDFLCERVRYTMSWIQKNKAGDLIQDRKMSIVAWYSKELKFIVRYKINSDFSIPPTRLKDAYTYTLLTYQLR